MVNQGTLTFHSWLSRLENIDHPDFVLFDLDLGKSTAFADLIKIAKELHKEFEAERLDNFIKTSGKTGLHVLAQWIEPGGYDDARTWALSIAQRVTETLPASPPSSAENPPAMVSRYEKVIPEVKRVLSGEARSPPSQLRSPSSQLPISAFQLFRVSVFQELAPISHLLASNSSAA